jgi:RNA polymerase sigma factor (sigma-70 family)
MHFGAKLRRYGMEIAFSKAVGPAMAALTDASAVVVALYRERGPVLWAFGRRLGLDPEECDDAVQEAHLRLWTSLSRGDAVDDPAAWLFRVFYRIAMDHHRLSRRLRVFLERWAADEVGSAADRSTELSVWAAVDRLPVRRRAALYLHYRADLTFERVGVVMGITSGAARTHASRGVEAIRRRLTDVEGER